jgi:hypothetical protein
MIEYDRGEYCFSQLVDEGDWSYWGEAAISKSMCLGNGPGGLRCLNTSMIATAVYKASSPSRSERPRRSRDTSG